MTNETNPDESHGAGGGNGLLSITRRSYLTLAAAVGGLSGIGGVAAATSVIDDFEQYGSETTLGDTYSNHTGAFDVVTDTAFGGDRSLYSNASGGQFINSTSGLDTYPSIGDTVEWYTWSEADAGDRLHFLAQSETDRDDHYSIDHSLRDDRMRIGMYVDGTSEYFAVDSNFTTTRDNRWLRHRLETEDTGSAHAFTYEIYEYNASGDDTLLNSLSGSDAEASISDGREFSTGGIGWLVYGRSGTQRWFDELTSVSAERTVSVSTAEATNVGESSATLNGSLDDLGGAGDADVYFEWGPSGDLSNATTPQTLSSTGAFDADITGLESDTEYEYRAVAEASDGDADTGSSVTFATTATADTPPTIDGYTVTEAGSPNPHAEITAEWTVSDADGDLERVTVEVFDSGGTLEDSARTSVSESTASGTDEFQIKHVDGQTFDVAVTASDASGATASRTETVTE